MPTANAEKSVLNSILNFAGGKSLTYQCVDRIFNVTLFDHLPENDLAVDRAGNSSVAAFPVCSVSVLSVPPSLQPQCSTAKQQKKNSKVRNAIPVHGPNRDRLRLLMTSQKLHRCVIARQPRITPN